MLESSITYSDLSNREPDLLNTYTSSVLAVFITDAKKQLENILKNRGLKLRNLCKHFTLSTDKSVEDEVERQRVVASITGISGTVTIALYGTNDESSETWTQITPDTALSFTTNVTISTLIHDCYKYYKIVKTGTGTATVYLIETSFELPHILLSMVLAYKSLHALNGDVWESKWKDYDNRFEDALTSLNYSYDKDGDGTISALETNPFQVTWRR